MILYPPILQGTLPPCYFNSEKTLLTVNLPYTYSRGVNPDQVKGIQFLIKSVPMNNTLYQSEINTINEQNLYFISKDNNLNFFNSIHEGQYYKFQVSFISTDDEVGYWSTAGISKLIARPDCALRVEGNKCIGTYIPNTVDLNETLYSSYFTLELNGKIIEQSEDIVHRYVDGYSENYEVQEKYSLKTTLDYGREYQVYWHITTNNNYQEDIGPISISNGDIRPQLYGLQPYINYDKDNAYVKIGIKQALEEDRTERNYGKYLIQRASGKDNFKQWITIGEIDNLSNYQLTYSNEECVLFRDFNLEYGENYRYSLQQIFSNNELSIRACSNTIVAYFDHMFLYDEDRQLCLAFNPKVSSFKDVLQEQKTEPLGGKYPIFFRNGELSYKEFSLSGLISYLEDQQNLFNDKIILNSSTQLTDSNFLNEVEFKHEVLNWLNDGKYKYFKSPAEGTYKVRLMNISLSPNDTLGRMLHTFQATAYEAGSIEDYEYKRCEENFVQTVSGEVEVFNRQVSTTGNIEFTETEEWEKYSNGIFTEIKITNIPINEGYIKVVFNYESGDPVIRYITQAGYCYTNERAGLQSIVFSTPTNETLINANSILVYFIWEQNTETPSPVLETSMFMMSMPYTLTATEETPKYYYQIQAREINDTGNIYRSQSLREKIQSGTNSVGPNILRITDSSYNVQEYIVIGQLLLTDLIAYKIEYGANLQVDCLSYGAQEVIENE